MSKPKDPEKEFIAWLRNILRQAFFRWHERTIALQQARVARGVYKCATCTGLFGNKVIKIDHIIPVVDPKTGFVDWQTYITRLFVPASGLQILCDECHRKKTNTEDEERRKFGTGRFSRTAIAKNAKARSENVELAQHLRSIAGNGGTRGKTGYSHPKHRVPIIATNMETGEVREFSGGLEAAKTLGLLHTNIVKILRGRRVPKTGWTFTYKETQHV